MNIDNQGKFIDRKSENTEKVPSWSQEIKGHLDVEKSHIAWSAKTTFRTAPSLIAVALTCHTLPNYDIMNLRRRSNEISTSL